MERKNTGWKILTGFLIIIILAMGGFITYDKVIKKKPEPKKCECKKYDRTKCYVENNDDKTTVKELKAQDIISYVTAYMIENDLASLDDTYQWISDKVTYMGYYKDLPDEKIYLVSGKFKCADQNDTTCVYQSVLEDPDEDGFYPFGAYVVIIEEDGEYTFGPVNGAPDLFSEDFVKVEKEIK